MTGGRLNAAKALGLTPDDTGPSTTITSGPSGRTSRHRATFKFTGSEPGVKFQCKHMNGPWTPCSSPKTYTGLGNGHHMFQVRAMDTNGNVDPTPPVLDLAYRLTSGVDLSAESATVRRTLPSRGTRIGAVLAGALVLLLAPACGGGDGGGGGAEDSSGLQAQAVAVGALLDKIEALPTSATTAQEFSAQLGPLRDQIQTLIEQVVRRSVPEKLGSQKEQLAYGLRGLRTQLGRIEGLLASDDLDGAKTATEQLISVQQIRHTIAGIEAAAGGG